MRGKIQALTAEGRFQAIILLALPPGVFVMMLGLNSEYGAILLKHPPLIWITVISEAIGALDSQDHPLRLLKGSLPAMPANGMVTTAAFLMASSTVFLVYLVMGGPQHSPRGQVEKPLGSG